MSSSPVETNLPSFAGQHKLLRLATLNCLVDAFGLMTLSWFVDRWHVSSYFSEPAKLDRGPPCRWLVQGMTTIDAFCSIPAWVSLQIGFAHCLYVQYRTAFGNASTAHAQKSLNDFKFANVRATSFLHK